jgi:hypothetical protein
MNIGTIQTTCGQRQREAEQVDDRKHHVADSQVLETHRCCVVSAVQSSSAKEFHEKKIAEMRLYLVEAGRCRWIGFAKEGVS